MSSRFLVLSVRWTIPFLATLISIALMRHTSEAPQFLSRYSGRYLIFLLASVFMTASSWWIALDCCRHRRMLARLRALSLLPLVGFGIGVLTIMDFFLPVNRFPLLIALVPLTYLVFIALLPNSTPHDLLRNLALLAASAAFALFLAEAAFRSAFLQRQVPASQDEFARLISLSWPHPIPVARDLGTYRILGLSDSFGRAGEHNNYHYVLERLLRNQGVRIEVTNFSGIGFEPTDQLQLLTRFADRFCPDLVLHGFFVGNDFSVPDGDLLSYRGIPVRPRSGLAAYRPQNFALATWVHRYVSVLAHERLRDGERERSGPPATFAEDEFLRIERERLEVARRDPPAHIRWVRTIHILDELRRQVANIGATYVLVIHPDQFQVEDSLRREVERVYNLDSQLYDPRLPQGFLAEYCVSRGIPCLDLLPMFRAHGSDGGLYLPRDTHYNTAGNTLAAATIGAFLWDRGLLTLRNTSPDCNGSSPKARIQVNSGTMGRDGTTRNAYGYDTTPVLR